MMVNDGVDSPVRSASRVVIEIKISDPGPYNAACLAGAAVIIVTLLEVEGNVDANTIA
jgi:hypothetical protein